MRTAREVKNFRGICCFVKTNVLVCHESHLTSAEVTHRSQLLQLTLTGEQVLGRIGGTKQSVLISRRSPAACCALGSRTLLRQ